MLPSRIHDNTPHPGYWSGYGSLTGRERGHGVDESIDLNGGQLAGRNLSCADLSGSNLYGAHLSGANLSGANLTFASLAGAKLPDGYQPNN